MTSFGFAVRAVAGVLAVAALSACASSGATSGASASAAATASPRGSRYVLTETDLAAAKADNLYDAIAKLRPDFLRGDQTGIVGQTDATGARVAGSPGGASSSGDVMHDSVIPVSVYRNGVRLGGLDDLRHMMMDEVKEVRFLKSADAIIRLGSENVSGAIVVTTK